MGTGRKRVRLGPVWRIGSVAGGAALLWFGIRRRSIPGALMAAAGSDLVYTAATGDGHLYNLAGLGRTKANGGRNTSVAYRSSIRVDESITINRPAEELFRYWRNFENLPRIMRHLEAVRNTGDKRSHWVARAPAGMRAEWDAEIINEIPNELLGWRSVNHPDVDNAGSVRFTPRPGDQGTIVHVVLRYDAPGGKLSAAFARLFDEEPSQQVREDLRRFKAILEAGEAPAT